ncbi:VOC family protein [Fulvivirgaceae bacterium BMA10]|uniref:VOC family protein n=1 Tax=Splendidivirga corallicola TaxID=3051826 RepID=A0ABT8KPL2_9BACT|nr:VOC family protein [Fulvivirgaceae bacterium BMA10]
MNYLIPYLVFPGTCQEAMEFYKESLNGEITLMQSFKDSPIEVSEAFQHRIFNSELKANGIHFKASDDLPDYETKIGSNVSLYAVFSDRQAKEQAFNKLLEGGKVLFPIEDNFGMLRDKYGVQWMVHHESG